jgi:hypothetical protein
MKFKKVITGSGICACDPNELMNDLKLICASIDAGNNNPELTNEGIRIIDSLLKLKVLSPEQHEKLYKKYFI